MALMEAKVSRGNKQARRHWEGREVRRGGRRARGERGWREWRFREKERLLLSGVTEKGKKLRLLWVKVCSAF